MVLEHPYMRISIITINVNPPSHPDCSLLHRFSMLDAKPKDKPMIPIRLFGWAWGGDERKSKTTPKSCEHRSAPSFEPCDSCAAEATRARKYRWKIILGLVFPFALQALDSTMFVSCIASTTQRVTH